EHRYSRNSSGPQLTLQGRVWSDAGAVATSARFAEVGGSEMTETVTRKQSTRVGGGRSVSGLSPSGAWFRQTFRACRSFLDLRMMPSADELVAEAIAATAKLPSASTATQHQILQSLLLNAALQYEAAIALRAHVDTHPIAARMFLASDGQQPASVFQAWAKTFASQIGRRDVCEMLAARMRGSAERAFPSRTFAREFGISEKQLNREFKTIFGVSVAAYYRTGKLVSALRLLATEDRKIEDIAGTVGYRSKKNFYAAFKKLFGVYPSAFRRGSFRWTTSGMKRVISLVPGPFRDEVAGIIRRRAEQTAHLQFMLRSRTD